MSQGVVRSVDEMFGEQLRAHRQRAGMSQQQLSDAVSKHGGSMHQTTIMRTERGERHATVGEFLLLAAALNVPPAQLLLPLGSEDLVEITPRSRIHPHLALDWLCGDQGLATTDLRVIDRARWLENSEPIRLYRRLRSLDRAYREAKGDLKRAEYRGDEKETHRLRNELADVLVTWHGHLGRMQSAGVKPPAMAVDVVDDMNAVGLDTSTLVVFEGRGDGTH